MIEDGERRSRRTAQSRTDARHTEPSLPRSGEVGNDWTRGQVGKTTLRRAIVKLLGHLLKYRPVVYNDVI